MNYSFLQFLFQFIIYISTWAGASKLCTLVEAVALMLHNCFFHKLKMYFLFLNKQNDNPFMCVFICLSLNVRGNFICIMLFIPHHIILRQIIWFLSLFYKWHNWTQCACYLAWVTRRWVTDQMCLVQDVQSSLFSILDYFETPLFENRNNSNHKPHENKAHVCFPHTVLSFTGLGKE